MCFTAFADINKFFVNLSVTPLAVFVKIFFLSYKRDLIRELNHGGSLPLQVKVSRRMYLLRTFKIVLMNTDTLLVTLAL